MKQLDYVLNNEKEVLAFVRSHYPMFHLSNVFFRDLQYGIQKLFERRGEKLSYSNAEKIARTFAKRLEEEKIFNRIDGQSWVLNYPEYRKPAVAPSAPAKPAPGAAPAKSPAAATPRAPLPPLGGGRPAGAKPALPPLTNAKPVGGAKPLPPLSSAKPAGAAPTPPEVAEQPAQQIEQQAKTDQPTVETSKPEQPASTSHAVPGLRKPLPPLKGNYTPAGKK